MKAKYNYEDCDDDDDEVICDGFPSEVIRGPLCVCTHACVKHIVYVYTLPYICQRDIWILSALEFEMWNQQDTVSRGIKGRLLTVTVTKSDMHFSCIAFMAQSSAALLTDICHTDNTEINTGVTSVDFQLHFNRSFRLYPTIFEVQKPKVATAILSAWAFRESKIYFCISPVALFYLLHWQGAAIRLRGSNALLYVL